MKKIKMILLFLIVFISGVSIAKADVSCTYGNNKYLITSSSNSVSGSIVDSRTSSLRFGTGVSSKFNDCCPNTIYISRGSESGIWNVSLNSSNGGTSYSLDSSSSAYKCASSSDESGTNASSNLDIKPLDICSGNSLKAFQIIGYVILVMKVLLPLVIIVLGSIDLAKAVIAGDDKSLPDKAWMLGKRLIAAAIVFFIPTIINVIVNMVDNARSTKESFKQCSNCLFHPTNNCQGSNSNTGNSTKANSVVNNKNKRVDMLK